MIVLDSAGFSLLVPLIYGHACNYQNQKERLPGKGAASIQVSGTDLKGQLGVLFRAFSFFKRVSILFKGRKP